MSIYDVDIERLLGGPVDLAQYRGKAMLVVNVASKCGLTPQYKGLQQLQDTYRDRGLIVIGVPCNQFNEQEPGTAEEIVEFCSSTFDIDFPLTEKVEVNGPNRHALYTELVDATDDTGYSGDVRWNFEKFIVAADGTVGARFGPATDPGSDEVAQAIEKALP